MTGALPVRDCALRKSFAAPWAKKTGVVSLNMAALRVLENLLDMHLLPG